MRNIRLWMMLRAPMCGKKRDYFKPKWLRHGVYTKVVAYTKLNMHEELLWPPLPTGSAATLSRKGRGKNPGQSS
jgi:hypothetical protein